VSETIWLCVGVIGLVCCILMRTAVRKTPLWIGAMVGGTAAGIAIFILTIFDGEWLPWLIGAGLSFPLWVWLDRAARRHGPQR
jgi:hypothetical protein